MRTYSSEAVFVLSSHRFFFALQGSKMSFTRKRKKTHYPQYFGALCDLNTQHWPAQLYKFDFLPFLQYSWHWTLHSLFFFLWPLWFLYFQCWMKWIEGSSTAFITANQHFQHVSSQLWNFPPNLNGNTGTILRCIQGEWGCTDADNVLMDE